MSSNVYEDAFIIRPKGDFLQQYPELKHAANALAIKYAFKELVTEDELKNIGLGLWRALDKATDFEQNRQKAGAKILPIIIESDNAAIQQLPWETLYHPEHCFIGKAEGYTLSRRLTAVTADKCELETGPLRVLLFTSLPDDLDAEASRLNVEEEQAQVQEALMPWIAKGIVKLEMPDDGRFSTLKQLLKEFDPHLLFLSGHGKFHHQPHSDEAPYGTFLFESETGSGDPIRDTQIAKALIGSRVQCVVLSACESGKATSDALNNGLTRQLSQLGIAHVIGMRESMLDRAGIVFAHHFCDAVARKERIDVSLQQARKAINTPLKDIARREADTSGLSELSLGQWCLPMLIQQDIGRTPIDWDFTPQIPEKPANQSLKSISLPPRFIGRRAELRYLKSRIKRGELKQLLITGPGGQGKTALAGKLAQDLRLRGHEILAWSARAENSWSKFLFELELQLSEDNAKSYDRMVISCENETEKAGLLLRLLFNQTTSGIVLFFDNLESIQQPETLELSDSRIQAWIAAAQSFCDENLTLLLTSRWQIPGWPDENHWGLEHASYGDFLQMAQQQSFAPEFFKDRGRLRRVYKTLHGNGRGLAFFAAAIQGMNLEQEETFLEKLAQAEVEIQTDMALDQIIGNLSPDERELLQRLPAYHTPVPIEGIIKLVLDIHQAPETMLYRLLAVSLVEKQYYHTWQTHQYQCSPLVTEWLQKQNMPAPNRQLLRTAAKYQRYLFDNERGNLDQAIIVHQALRVAGEKNEADRLALKVIIGKLSLFGFYQTLLIEWLPDICQSENRQIQAQALEQTGKQHLHLGDYDTALDYLKQSLAIAQEIGDKAGEGTTLNNISGIYNARGDYDTALDYAKQSLAIKQEIGNKAGEGSTLNNISLIYSARGDYDTALDYLKQSLAIAQEIGDKAGEGTTLNNISEIYRARGDYDTALDYLKQSLAIAQEIEDKAVEGATLNNISLIYSARGDYDTALDYLKQSLAIQQEIRNKAGEGATLDNISQIYDARGDYDTAFEYLKQSLAIRQEIGDSSGFCVTLFNIGHIHHQNEEFPQALQAWVTVYRQAKSMNLAQVLDALENLANQLKLPGGLDGWEKLAKQIEDAEQ